MERLLATIFYGSMMGVTLILAWGSGRVVPQKIALWMALDWVIYNIAFETLGPAHEPWVGPSVEAAIVVGIGALAVKHKSRVAWAVIAAYVAEETVSLGGFMAHMQGTVAYYGMLNALFVVRLLIVWGASAYGLAHWFAPSGPRAVGGGLRRGAR